MVRRRATDVVDLGTGWHELTVDVGDPEVLAEELVSHGANVLVVQPPELRDAVVRRLRGVLAGAAEDVAGEGAA
jgi:predicted DNA-binding transcriptional regulator YafY